MAFPINLVIQPLNTHTNKIESKATSQLILSFRLVRSPQRLAEARIFLCFQKDSRLPKAFGIAGMTTCEALLKTSLVYHLFSNLEGSDFIDCNHQSRTEIIHDQMHIRPAESINREVLKIQNYFIKVTEQSFAVQVRTTPTSKCFWGF